MGRLVSFMVSFQRFVVLNFLFLIGSLVFESHNLNQHEKLDFGMALVGLGPNLSIGHGKCVLSTMFATVIY